MRLMIILTLGCLLAFSGFMIISLKINNECAVAHHSGFDSEQHRAPVSSNLKPVSIKSVSQLPEVRSQLMAATSQDHPDEEQTQVNEPPPVVAPLVFSTPLTALPLVNEQVQAVQEIARDFTAHVASISGGVWNPNYFYVWENARKDADEQLQLTLGTELYSSFQQQLESKPQHQ